METLENVKAIVKAMEDKKAGRIFVIDISEISTIGDYFVICDGNNSNQIQAIADNIDEEMNKCGISPRQIEGYNNANWILIDYSDIIVHIFDVESRDFYDLERIWRDGKKVEI